jgi:hypothetical protein
MAKKCFRVTGTLAIGQGTGLLPAGAPAHHYFCAEPGSFEIVRILSAEFQQEVPDAEYARAPQYYTYSAVGLKLTNGSGWGQYVYIHFNQHTISQVEAYSPGRPNDVFITRGGCETCACNKATHCIVPCPGSPEGHCCLSKSFLKVYSDYVIRLTNKDD